MKLLHFIPVLLFLTALSSRAQENTSELQQFEKNLIILRKQVIKAGTDEERKEANEEFVFLLDQALKLEGAFEYGFDSIPKIGNLRSPDGKFRIINWNLPFDNNTHDYFCYIQQYNKKKKLYQVHKLTNKSSEITSPARKVTGVDNWYGALYYEIIPFKRGSREYYLLLGWKGNNAVSTKKVVEVLQFPGNKPPRFGATVFKMEEGNPRRLIFEYSADVTMSVKYHKKRKQIIYNRLEPREPQLEGLYEFYFPTTIFDALELTKGKWLYKKDVDIRVDLNNKPFNPPPGLKN